jgi:Zonular occludens toxin (Zot)
MPISLVYGRPGSGKSFFSLFYSLQLAERQDKVFVTNFLLHPLGLLQYCKIMGYKNLEKRIRSDNSRIYYQPLNSDVEKMLQFSDSIILCDEAAIYFPARQTYNTPKKILSDLVQIRHRNQHLFLICQSEQQIDVQLKILADEIFYCSSTSVLDSKGNQKMISKSTLYFLPDQYDSWRNNPKVKRNPLKSRLSATKSFGGWLSISDIYLFHCYNSFNLIHEESESSITSSDFYPSYSLRANDSLYSISGFSCRVPSYSLSPFLSASLSRLFSIAPASLYRYRSSFISFLLLFNSFSRIEFRLSLFLLSLFSYFVTVCLVSIFNIIF